MRIFAVLCLVFVSSSALAAAKALPKDGYEAVAAWPEDAIITNADHTTSLFRSYLGYATAYQKSYVQQEIDKKTAAVVPLHKAKTDFFNAQQSLQKDMTKASDRFAEKQREIDAMQTKVDELKVRIDKDDPQNKNERAKLERDIAKLAPVRDRLKQEAETAAGVFKAKEKEYLGEYAKFDAQNKELTSMLSEEQRKRLAETGLEKGIDNVLSKMKETSYDAKFLLADMNTLVKDYDVAQKDLLLKKLQEKIDGSLGNDISNTVMGKYVNGQILKAMGDVCNLQAKCSVEGLSGVESRLKEVLSMTRDDAKKASAQAMKPIAPEGPKDTKPASAVDSAKGGAN